MLHSHFVFIGRRKREGEGGRERGGGDPASHGLYLLRRSLQGNCWSFDARVAGDARCLCPVVAKSAGVDATVL